MKQTLQPSRTPLELALTFLQVSMISFGGGLSAHTFNILVEKKAWLNREEFLSFVAISRLFPGANTVNLAVCIGNHCGGLAGALAAVTGLLLVPLVLVTLLGLLYFQFHYLPGVAPVLNGMAAVAVGLTLSMGLRTLEDYWGGVWPLIIITVCFVMIALFRWSMFWVLLLLVPVSLYWSYRHSRRAREADE